MIFDFYGTVLDYLQRYQEPRDTVVILYLAKHCLAILRSLTSMPGFIGPLSYVYRLRYSCHVRFYIYLYMIAGLVSPASHNS